MRILLVEDDETLNHSLAFQLEAEGFLVDTCRDGEEALYYMEEHIHDLVLLDRMLPLLSGTQVLERMRAQGDQTPVILIIRSPGWIWARMTIWSNRLLSRS